MSWRLLCTMSTMHATSEWSVSTAPVGKRMEGNEHPVNGSYHFRRLPLGLVQTRREWLQKKQVLYWRLKVELGMAAELVTFYVLSLLKTGVTIWVSTLIKRPVPLIIREYCWKYKNIHTDVITSTSSFCLVIYCDVSIIGSVRSPSQFTPYLKNDRVRNLFMVYYKRSIL